MRSSFGQALKGAVEAASEVLFPVMSLASGHITSSIDEPQFAMVEPRTDFDGIPFLQGMGAVLKALSLLIGYSQFLRTRKPSNRLSAPLG
ncbi:hypothetical protein NLM27_26290 [Bradyrhizobium sp. CCGB12]|uniref:hypothetical protein n=1 Tax=Bradyrhizobium sp. CCGB12 TaxID=2949632 RepID=UPI0020B382C2|nr:hypothetical protein [Bradyrhizobium sp. CCGB12]MCP3392271.1 hypothetical protein [Bradyrhizobium sp. CCGB12]